MDLGIVNCMEETGNHSPSTTTSDILHIKSHLLTAEVMDKSETVALDIDAWKASHGTGNTADNVEKSRAETNNRPTVHVNAIRFNTSVSTFGVGTRNNTLQK